MYRGTNNKLRFWVNNSKYHHKWKWYCPDESEWTSDSENPSYKKCKGYCPDESEWTSD